MRLVLIIATMLKMETRVKQNLVRLGVKQGDTLGAAVSGGVDSMVLLHILCRIKDALGVDIAALHMEHGIRGEASREDMHFVQAACEALGVRCITARADVPAIAKEKGLSVETAARQERYAFLDAQDFGWIVTAHHMDDNAETVIMNLVRGSGLSGLCGIPERRGKYIRPMLSISRGEIEVYANENSIKYVQDSTNDDTAYTRNYIRKEVLPRLGRINEGAAANIARTAKLIAEDEDALEAAAKGAGAVHIAAQEVHIDIEKLTAQHTAVQRRIVRRAIGKTFGLKDIERVHVEAVLDLAYQGVSARRVHLPGGLEVKAVYDKLVIGKNRTKRYNEPLVYLCGNGHCKFGGFAFECRPLKGDPVFGEGAEYFDEQATKGAVFRHRQEADWIQPLGMDGTKRLSDYLSDRKVPLYKRDDMVLLANGSEVFWVVGVGVSQTSKMREGRRAVKITYWEKDHA